MAVTHGGGCTRYRKFHRTAKAVPAIGSSGIHDVPPLIPERSTGESLFSRLREHGAINVVQIPRLYGFAGGALDRAFEIGLALERFMVHDQVRENGLLALCAPYAQQRHIVSLSVDSAATPTLNRTSGPAEAEPPHRIDIGCLPMTAFGQKRLFSQMLVGTFVGFL
jgi:hypothetical protein